MSVKIKHLNIVLHNYFNVENITTYYTLKKSLCTIILTIFYYYFYLSNMQNNIQMLNFYTIEMFFRGFKCYSWAFALFCTKKKIQFLLRYIFISIMLQLFETYQNNY